jgi:hypothetical protein
MRCEASGSAARCITSLFASQLCKIDSGSSAGSEIQLWVNSELGADARRCKIGVNAALLLLPVEKTVGGVTRDETLMLSSMTPLPGNTPRKPARILVECGSSIVERHSRCNRLTVSHKLADDSNLDQVYPWVSDLVLLGYKRFEHELSCSDHAVRYEPSS